MDGRLDQPNPGRSEVSGRFPEPDACSSRFYGWSLALPRAGVMAWPGGFRIVRFAVKLIDSSDAGGRTSLGWAVCRADISL
jgi:hypothetical protein